jgi:protocatechuate 3,4-dioxygenase beta subunit
MYYRVQLFFLLLVSGNSFAQSNDSLASLQKARSLLHANTNVEQILTDDQWMFLHAKTEFRQLIKEFGKNSRLTITNNREPGEKITVYGFVKDVNDHPLPEALVYVYHTDNRGFYAFDTTHVMGNEGDRRHARLFGYLKTDKEGRFTLQTIHPKGYPKSSLPSHIHCEIESSGRNTLITELLFDEDARLTPDQRVRSQQEGFIISKEKDGAYSYVITLK